MLVLLVRISGPRVNPSGYYRGHYASQWLGSYVNPIADNTMIISLLSCAASDGICRRASRDASSE